LPKSSIFAQNFKLDFLAKISICAQNFHFWTKIPFMPTISIFAENFDFFPNILIFAKNFDFAQTLGFLLCSCWSALIFRHLVLDVKTMKIRCWLETVEFSVKRLTAIFRFRPIFTRYSAKRTNTTNEVWPPILTKTESPITTGSQNILSHFWKLKMIQTHLTFPTTHRCRKSPSKLLSRRFYSIIRVFSIIEYIIC